MNITFDFIRENFKTVCRNVLVVDAPFCILFAVILLQQQMGKDVWNTKLEWMDFLHIEDSASIFTFFPILTAAAVMPMAFTLIDLHYTRNGGISGLKFKDVRMPYFLNLAKWFLSFLPFIIFAVLVIPVLIKGGEWFWTIILTGLVFFFFEMAPPAFIIGKKDFGASMGTTIEYAFSYFWNSLFITLLLLMVGVLIFLWEIGAVQAIDEVKHQVIGNSPDGNIVAYIIYWIILLAIFLALAASVALALTALTVGIAFQYGSLEERKHQYVLTEKINNFEKLKDV